MNIYTLNISKRRRPIPYRNFFFSILAVSIPSFLSGFTMPGGDAGLAYDFFRSLPEGDWDGNTGGYGSINLAMPFSYCDLGVQFGGSYGIYDWSGRTSSNESTQNDVQQQLFLTGGLFRKASCGSGVNAGIVCDWMWNKKFSLFGVDTSFSQLRGQLGYLYCNANEYGLWGTVDLGTSHVYSQGISLEYRAISQANIYWKHNYCNGAETYVWVGVPYKKSLAYDSGRAGKVLIGASFRTPLCERFFIEGYGSYMVPHSSSGLSKQQNYAANICLEIKYYFGDRPCQTSPLMPVANNTNFIADTNYSLLN